MPTRARRARRGEGRKLRDSILDAADRLLTERGRAELVPVRAVAEACGCTPPALYMHFAGKDDLFRAVGARRLAALEASLEAIDSDDPLESLRARAGGLVRFGIDHPHAYRLVMGDGAAESDGLPGLSAGMAIFRRFVDAAERCVEEGALPTTPGAVPAATALWSAAHGLTSLLVTYPTLAGEGADELIDYVLDVQIEGLLAT